MHIFDTHQHVRTRGRADNQLRPLSVAYHVFPNAAGSVLFSLGETKILCAVMLQAGVPPFLKGSKRGWLTAEYSLLPASTPVRSAREVSTQRRNGRSIEISRLIGRTLRSIVHLNGFGEQTITIDCDVLNADGSTRVASIIAAYLALRSAEKTWHKRGILQGPLLGEELAAISIGLTKGRVLVDIDCAEDNAVDADFNFIVTRTNRLLEIQGGAEQTSVSWEEFEQVRHRAQEGAQQLFAFFDRKCRKYECLAADDTRTP